MPRAKVPRPRSSSSSWSTSAALPTCTVFGCSRRAAEDGILLARRVIAQGRRYALRARLMLVVDDSLDGAIAAAASARGRLTATFGQ
jgi:hypothetical protein